jgi:Ca-activated chloride channel family protein
MRARALLIAAALTAGVAVDLTAARQRFRSGVDAVAVDVLVTRDRHGVVGLSAENFALFDSGVPQRIDGVFFQTLPLNIVMALDTSGSTSGRPLDDLKEAARAVVRGLQDGDRMALLTFSHVVELGSGWTSDRAALLTAIDRTTAGGPTALRDATFTALMLTERVDGRSLLLVFSDGQDNTSWLRDAQVIDAATRTDAVVYTVQTSPLPAGFSAGELRTLLLRAPQVTGTYFLPAVAHETGGDALWVRDSREVEKVFLRILDEFRSRYVLTYSPQGVSASGWHPIEVRLKGARGDIRARRGYLRQ